MLSDEQAGPDQLAALRAMTGEERLRVAERLCWSVRKMKTAGIRAQHPDWTEEQINEQVRQIYLHAGI